MNKIYIGVPFEEGYACFKRIKKTKFKTIEKIANEMDISVSEYIFELLYDSYKDNSLLLSYIEE